MPLSICICRAVRSRSFAIGCVALGALVAGCSSPQLPSAEHTQPVVPDADTSPPQSSSRPSVVAAPASASTASIAPEPSADLVVRADIAGRPLDRRVLGTNVPAWLGPAMLADPAFQRATVESGTTLLRMPGGSWSNSYDWSACEKSDAERCFWPWAARPTDFANFMKSTDLPGLWTVSINETAQSAAAAVAFFNGRVGDSRPIGVDRERVDWGTVDTWAQLRTDHGNADPVRIDLWEVGNEVFGGRPDTGGEECAPFGWEDVWTCDGTDYVTGDADHDGFLAIREAMILVDPSISVGAVGVAHPDSWSDWGHEVVRAAGDALDFYTVHQYGFDNAPSEAEALAQPAALWPQVIADVRSALPDDVPIAVTEHNLVAVESGDGERMMTRAVNALYLADSIGQLVVGGVPIANQWNLANGTTTSGTDYGMIKFEDLSFFPQYHAMAMWGATGASLLTTEGAAPDNVRVYATERDDGTIVVMLINLDEADRALGLRVVDEAAVADGFLRTMRTDDLGADALIEGPRQRVLASPTGTFDLVLAPWSMNLLEVAGVD